MCAMKIEGDVVDSLEGHQFDLIPGRHTSVLKKSRGQVNVWVEFMTKR